MGSSAEIILEYPWKSANDKMKQTLHDCEENDNVAITLSDHLLKIAKKELREDKYCRDQCLTQLRDWILKNEDIQNMRFDDQFLLRFLRVKKFSIPMAQQLLLKYLNLRRTFPHMLNDLDFLSPKLNEIITNGYIFVSPVRDSNGRRVVIVMAKNFNPKIYSSWDQARAHFITYESLMEDQENQIIGLTHVGDFSGVTATHVTNWNPTEFARIFKWGEQSLPIRHKEIHIVNVASTMKWLIDFVKTRISAKIRNRLSCHVSEKELYKHINVECLPLEMGGRIPMRDMIDSWKKELAQRRDLLLSLDKITLLSDRGILTKRSPTSSSSNDKLNGTHFASQIESITGSFRKLEID